MFLNVLCFEIDFDSSLILTPCCKPSYLSLEDVSFGQNISYDMKLAPFHMKLFRTFLLHDTFILDVLKERKVFLGFVRI